MFRGTRFFVLFVSAFLVPIVLSPVALQSGGADFGSYVSGPENRSTDSQLSPVASADGEPPIARSSSASAIPAAAWQRPVGDIPFPTVGNDPNRGICLGGFGAGAFMYNISGSFGPWADEVGEYNNSRLSGAAFHIYEMVGDDVRAKCLSTDTTMLPAWPRMAVGEGTYYALHPKGWIVYDGFTTDIQNLFFSPIIAHNYRETSYPVAVWEFTLSNPTADSVEISIMFTWPNPPFNGGNRVRTGFSNSQATEPGKFGIVQKADHAANEPETQNSEWCIAARWDQTATVSRATWDPSGEGSDIWDQFVDDGVLSNQINLYDSAAAIAVKVKLSAGETVVVPFSLAWDFPVVEFNGTGLYAHSTQWWKRYCEYFDTLSDNSFEIASLALDDYEDWLGQIDNWTSPFVDDPRFPEWLIRAGFNELYYNQFGGSFWESGLRSGHPQEFMGLHPEDHKNFIMESLVYTLSGNLSVGHYSSVVYARFWPEMERDLLRCHADYILHYDLCDPTALHQTASEIGAPRDFLSEDGCTIGDPFFVVDPHRYQSRPGPCEPGDFHLQTEMSSKFIQRCWRHYALHEDLEFLTYVWPAVKSTYQYMKSYDCGAVPDSLPDAQGYDNTYDGWAMYGTDIYSGGFWVGALQAMDTMAAILNEPIRGDIQAWLEAARRNLDEQLWDADGRYYRIDTDSEYPTAVFADALGGQRYGEAYGLPNILPRWKLDAHLQKVYKICVSPNPLYGARLGRMPDSSTVPSNDRDNYEYWVGTTYYLAAMMYHAGMKSEALTTAYGAYYTVWETEHLAYWFNTPEAWTDEGFTPRPGSYYYPAAKQPPGYATARAPGETPVNVETANAPQLAPHQYQRARAVWELIFEMQRTPLDVPSLVRPEDFAYLVDSTPTFRWTQTMAGGGSYTLQYARDANFTIEVNTITEIHDSSYVVPAVAALDDGVWHWHVQAIDSEGIPSGYQQVPYSFSIDTGLPCDCSDLGDCNGDHAINPVDVVIMVNHVYKNSEPVPPVLPYCPAINGDWNCDDAVNPNDVVLIVNFVYKGRGPAPCDPCE